MANNLSFNNNKYNPLGRPVAVRTLAKRIAGPYNWDMRLPINAFLVALLAFSLLVFGPLYGMALAGGSQQVKFGRWSETELAELISRARRLKDPAQRISAISAHFLDTPYVADTLIGGPQISEQLVVNLAGFDCFTLLDTVEALRRTSNLAEFFDRLQQVRYRQGRLGYEHRRHFFSDWVADEGAMIADVTATVGRKRVRRVVKHLNLKHDGSLWLPGIPVTRRLICYIPTDIIDEEVLSALQTGDYVGIYSEQVGLDVRHTGLIVKGEQGVMLRHASSLPEIQRVVDVDLRKYLQDKPGLVVYRVKSGG